MYDILQLNDMILPELRETAEKLKVKGSEKMEKQELILKILDAQALNPETQNEAAPSKENKMKKLRFWYEVFMERTIRKVIREIKFRRQLKKQNKRDPYIY